LQIPVGTEYAVKGVGNGVFAMKLYSFKAATAIAALVGSLAMAGSANATLTITSVNGGAPGGVVLDNLDWLTTNGNNAAPNTTGGLSPQSGMSVSFSPDGGAVQGNVSGVNAAPFLSGNNGNGFGNPLYITDQPNGQDTTVYVTAGGIQGSSATLLLPDDELYFGLLWGSVDTYNTLEFYDSSNNLVGTLTGSDVTAFANGDQGAAGTFYVSINSDVAFNRVVATSSEHAFEIDNISFNQTIPSPEPITLSLFGAGLAGLGLVRRRRKA
jgi:hypothetical protein